MGRSKALLPVPDGRTFVRCLSEALWSGGVAEVLVAGRPEDTALRTEVARLDLPVRFVENGDADRGPLMSILAGLLLADHPGVHGLLVTPVDLPLVTAATVSALLARFHSTKAPIVRAVHGGAHGHPVVFSRAVFGELRGADPALGAKAVVRAHADTLVNLEVPDPGVLTDIDTPDEYERVFGRPVPS